MKKLLQVLVVAMMMASLVACSNNDAKPQPTTTPVPTETAEPETTETPEVQPSVEATLESALPEVMAAVYSTFKPEELPMLMQTEVTAENAESFIGTNEVDFKEGLASEPAMSSIPHSVVLLRMNEGADIEATKELIREKIDPRKWVCVGVERDEVIIESQGDLIIVIIDDDTSAEEAHRFDRAKTLQTNFLNLQ